MLKVNNNSLIFANLNLSFCCLPSIKVSNLNIAKEFSTQNKCPSDVAIAMSRHTGIFERRYAKSSEAASDLAIKALKNTPISPSEIGGLIVATTSGDYPSPATAHLVHKGLNLPNHVHCLDVASSCTSFLSALRSSFGFIATNENTIIVASEVKHKGLAKDDLRTLSLFGDGCAGIYLKKNNLHDKNKDFFMFCHQDSQSSLAENICIPIGGSRNPVNINNLHRNKLEFLNPKLTYLQTVKAIAEAIEKSWEKRNQLIHENFTDHNIKIPGTIFIHQANKNIIHDVKLRLNPKIAKCIPILMADIGNMVCASLPVLRTRILFLKSIFYFKKEKLLKNSLVEYFFNLCRETNLFSFTKHNSGIIFSTKWENENIYIFDDDCNSLEESWLAKICNNEFNDLINIFENEFKTCQNQPTCEIKYIDIWVAAGGGFQTLSVIHGKI